MSSDKDVHFVRFIFQTNQNDKPNISNDLVDISSDSSNGKTEPQKIKIDDKDLSHSERPAKRPRISVEQSERKVIDLDDPKIKEISKNNETKTEQSQSAQNLPPLKEDEHQFQYLYIFLVIYINEQMGRINISMQNANSIPRKPQDHDRSQSQL